MPVLSLESRRAAWWTSVRQALPFIGGIGVVAALITAMFGLPVLEARAAEAGALSGLGQLLLNAPLIAQVLLTLLYLTPLLLFFLRLTVGPFPTQSQILLEQEVRRSLDMDTDVEPSSRRSM